MKCNYWTAALQAEFGNVGECFHVHAVESWKLFCDFLITLFLKGSLYKIQQLTHRSYRYPAASTHYAQFQIFCLSTTLVLIFKFLYN